MSGIRDSRDSRDQYRPIEELSHAEAAGELLGQVVRAERDHANRNDTRYSPEIKIASAQIHALLAIADVLERISVALEEGS